MRLETQFELPHITDTSDECLFLTDNDSFFINAQISLEKRDVSFEAHRNGENCSIQLKGISNIFSVFKERTFNSGFFEVYRIKEEKNYLIFGVTAKNELYFPS